MVALSEIQKVFSLLETTHQQTMLEELSDYTPFQMLVMTLLSARTKDSTTIPIVKEMFAKYPEPEVADNLNGKSIPTNVFSSLSCIKGFLDLSIIAII